MNYRETYGSMNHPEMEIRQTPVKSAFPAFKPRDSFHFVPVSLYSFVTQRLINHQAKGALL
ncbi:MAG: hypothetical protein LBJ12_04800 [Oscillospiraceae bacterium]|jgi:hypothetical protein|nr:hypothetical protein [Oscillospiraceae bacterium]